MLHEPMGVGQFVTIARGVLVSESALTQVSILGELTKLTMARSGHSYFTLTDSGGSIDCVYFRGNAEFIAQDIREGTKVIVHGSIDVYVNTGRMQFKATKVEPLRGIGDLERIRRELIQKWRMDGTLDRPRKKLPMIPKRLHIITGAKSAALSDMERIIHDRWPNFNYKVIPVLVQGNSAPRQIIDAIKASQDSADLIIVGRGGGSPEDLWAFNLESVCQAIIDSKPPVVSAIGHESDLLVSDMVADLRASTPSNAIERVVPIREELTSQISQAKDRLDFAMDRFFQSEYQKISQIRMRLISAPLRGLSKAKLRQAKLQSRITSAMEKYILLEKSKMEAHGSLLASISPVKVLERGYSMALDPEGRIITSKSDVNSGDYLTVVVQDGQIETKVR